MTAAVVATAVLLFVVGTAWDVQWHVNVGRDRVLTPPHQLMLGGMALAGLVSLLLVLRESWLAWRESGATPGTTRFLGVFHAPLGFFVAGFGTLLGVIAFPLDDYWHTLYGIDVTLWAPFHVMIVMSMVMAGLGGVIALGSELHHVRAGGMRNLIQVLWAAAYAFTFAALLILLAQANVTDGLARMGGYEFVLYPILLAGALPLAVSTTAIALPLPGGATLMALIFVALRGALFSFVPWAVDVTVAAEGLSYRTPVTVIVTPFAFPTAILAVALVVDAAHYLLRNSRYRLPAVLILGAAASVAATAWDQPWAHTMPRWYFPGLDVTAVYLRSLPFAAVAALAGSVLAYILGRGLQAADR